MKNYCQIKQYWELHRLQKNKEITQRRLVTVEKALETVLKSTNDCEVKKHSVEALYAYKEKLLENLSQVQRALEGKLT